MTTVPKSRNGVRNPNRAAIVTISVLVASLIIVFLVAVSIGISIFPNENVPAQLAGAKQAASLINKIELMTYDQAIQFCASTRKVLPLPKSRQEEDDLISRVNNLDSVKNCDVFYLGYTLKENLRYESLDGKKTWPSLNVSLKAAQPSLDRDCLVFSFKPVKTLAIKPCKDVRSSCYATYHSGETCWRSMTDCVTINTISKDIDIITAYGDIKKRNEVLGIAVIDDHSFPYSLLRLTPAQNSCVALAVRNRFEYYAPDGSSMPYTSDRFVSDDSEVDCLGIAPGPKAVVPSIPCDTVACVWCS